MAMGLLLRAMAHQRYAAAFGQFLKKTQRELLTVVLDGFVFLINGFAFGQFLPVATAELRPGDPVDLELSQQFFARAEVRHPDVVPIDGHSSTTKSSNQNA